MTTPSRLNLIAAALAFGTAIASNAKAADLTPAEVRAIAKEVCIYGYGIGARGFSVCEVRG